MDGSPTTPVACALPTLGTRESARPWRWLVGRARRREQLRLLSDRATRAAAARLVDLKDPEADAFDALYQRYAPYVAVVGARILIKGRDDELDELVQDVFMQVLRGLDQLCDPAAFKAWLARLTIRGATRHLRKRSLRRQLMTAEPASAEQCMLGREVYNQLDVLPPSSRVIWVLRHVAGEPLHVIAARLRCSLSTVQRRLLEAQSTLEDRFREDYAV